MTLDRSSLENYTLLLVELEKMRYTKFNAKTFLKQIRPFCKTEHLSFKRLNISIRGSNKGLTIHVKKDAFIVIQNHAIHEFIFYCDTQNTSSKYLLNKLLKHKLLIY